MKGGEKEGGRERGWNEMEGRWLRERREGGTN